MNGNGPPRLKRNLRRPSGPEQYPSFWHVFANSHRRSTGKRRGGDPSDDDGGFSTENNNDSEDDADIFDFQNGEEEENISPNGTRRNTCHSDHPPIT